MMRMANITVKTKNIAGKISPNVYGQMVEHAYWSVHLGLCAQMLDNGGFELDRDQYWNKVAQGWKVVSTHSGNACRARLDSGDPYNGNHCQRLEVAKYAGGAVRLLQNGLSVEAGKKYKGFVILRGDCKAVSVKLLSVTRAVIDETPVQLTDDWREYEFVLSSSITDHAVLFVIELRGAGTLYADQAFLYPEDRYGGARADMVKLYRELAPPFVRWPGGAYLIWHRWKEGIGPLKDRPYNDGRQTRDRNYGIYHDGEWDANAFGTDEFVAFCRDIGAEPMINVNIKDGLQGALDWIEYCNGDPDTEWGAKRVQNGHPQPYNVKYWVIDNEPLCGTEKKGYSEATFPYDNALWAREMKRKDANIMVMCMGDHDMQSYIDDTPAFCETVTEAAKDSMDHLCVHAYYDENVVGMLQGMPYKLGEIFGRLKAMINRHIPERDAKVFFSEWNPQCNANIGGNMGQAIEAAQLLHVMERASAAGILDFATPCQLCVNVDRYRGFWLRGSMVQINNHAAWVSPMYHVYSVYARLRLPNLLETTIDHDSKVQSDTFGGYEFPAVDIVAAGGEDGNKIVIKICNNTPDRNFDLRFALEDFAVGRAIAHEVSAGSILDINTEFSPNTVVERISDLRADAGAIAYTIRKNTVALIEVFAK